MEDKKHDEENDDCDCYECLEKDYNDPHGSWFPDDEENSDGFIEDEE